jgi:hypothetical protein
MEPIVDPLLAKTDTRKREIMTKMEAWREADKRAMEACEVEHMARREAIEAKYRARKREADAIWSY